MAVIVDTSAIYAAYDTDATAHRSVIGVLEDAPGPFVVSAGILAEIGYMLGEHLGANAMLRFVESFASDLFLLEQVERTDLRRCAEILRQYEDQKLGLADASIVATAERLRVQTILTLDERHFRTIRPRGFDHFILYPADFNQ
jgi:predicted nucleic acid-binding protein